MWRVKCETVKPMENQLQTNSSETFFRGNFTRLGDIVVGDFQIPVSTSKTRCGDGEREQDLVGAMGVIDHSRIRCARCRDPSAVIFVANRPCCHHVRRCNVVYGRARSGALTSLRFFYRPNALNSAFYWIFFRPGERGSADKNERADR